MKNNEELSIQECIPYYNPQKEYEEGDVVKMHGIKAEFRFNGNSWEVLFDDVKDILTEEQLNLISMKNDITIE